MELIFGVGKAIDNMNITAVQNCPTNQRTSVCADGIFRKMLDPFRLRIVSASGIVLTIISHSNMMAYSESQRSPAVRTIASRTGFMLVGEPEMTRSTWPVAVCCPNDSRSSFNSRAFSIAITA